jgi:hypothetical protein
LIANRAALVPQGTLLVVVASSTSMASSYVAPSVAPSDVDVQLSTTTTTATPDRQVSITLEDAHDDPADVPRAPSPAKMEAKKGIHDLFSSHHISLFFFSFLV